MTVGTIFSHNFIVDSEVYNGFLQTFKDHNPLHTDSGFASSKGFKDVIMYGNILNGFLSYFVGELLPQKNVMIIQQEINYQSPVFLNDILSFEAVITELFPSIHAVAFKYQFRNNDLKSIAKGKILITIL